MDWDVALGIVLRDFIRDYQTLITGFMAIAAAVIAVKARLAAATPNSGADEPQPSRLFI